MNEKIIAGICKIASLTLYVGEKRNNVFFYSESHSNPQLLFVALDYWEVSLLMSRSGKKIRDVNKKLLYSGNLL